MWRPNEAVLHLGLELLLLELELLEFLFDGAAPRRRPRDAAA